VTNGTSITTADLTRLSQLIGEDLTTTSTQNKIKAGTIGLLEFLRADLNGDLKIDATDYNLLNNYINGTINSFPVGSYFTHLELDVQQAVSRFDGYYPAYIPGSLTPETSIADLRQYGLRPVDSGVSFSLLSVAEKLFYGNYLPVHMEIDNVNLAAVPFSPINFRIENVSFWMPDYLTFTADAREVPVTFSYTTGIFGNGCSTNTSLYSCVDRIERGPVTDPGRNDLFVPGNIVMKPGAQIMTPDGEPFKFDYEVGIITVELPSVQIINKTLDIFNSFVRDQGNGQTSKNFPAMKYASCNTVKAEDLLLNKVKFDVSIQSYVSSDGYDGYVGANTSGIIGSFMDQNTGLLRIYSNNLVNNILNANLVTRLTIKVLLKESSWNNYPLTLSKDQISGLLV